MLRKTSLERVNDDTRRGPAAGCCGGVRVSWNKSVDIVGTSPTSPSLLPMSTRPPALGTRLRNLFVLARSSSISLKLGIPRCNRASLAQAA